MRVFACTRQRGRHGGIEREVRHPHRLQRILQLQRQSASLGERLRFLGPPEGQLGEHVRAQKVPLGELKDQPHPGQTLGAAHVAEVGLVRERDATPGGFAQSGDEVQQGGLAETRSAHDEVQAGWGYAEGSPPGAPPCRSPRG